MSGRVLGAGEGVNYRAAAADAGKVQIALGFNSIFTFNPSSSFGPSINPHQSNPIVRVGYVIVGSCVAVAVYRISMWAGAAIGSRRLISEPGAETIFDIPHLKLILYGKYFYLFYN